MKVDMLSGLPFSKRRSKRDAAKAASREPSVGASSGGVAQTADFMEEIPPAEAQAHDSASDARSERAGATAAQAVPVADFARRHRLSEAEVWRRLRAGELLGRSEKGRLMVLDDGRGDLEAGDLPPLPGQSTPLLDAALTVGQAAGASSEMALLLDHLSLAKEENREILKMTQDAIRKVTELTDSVVTMKNAVIESKDSQIDALREQLAAREQRIKALLQKNEDLEMLARALADRPAK
jgi:hypothetical protein